MKTVELSLAPAIQNDTIDKAWEKIPVRGAEMERHHAIPQRTFDRELKAKIEDVMPEKKVAKRTEQKPTEPVPEKVNEEVKSDVVTPEVEEKADTSVESVDVTEKVDSDPVNTLINEKIEKIKALCEKLGIDLGIDVDTDNLTSDEFLVKAIKILEHLLNPIHEDGAITVRISVEDAVAQMQIADQPVEVTEEEVLPLMESLLYELMALQTLLCSGKKEVISETLLPEETVESSEQPAIVPVTDDVVVIDGEEIKVEVKKPEIVKENTAVDETSEKKSVSDETVVKVILEQTPVVEKKSDKLEILNTDNVKVDEKSEEKPAKENFLNKDSNEAPRQESAEIEEVQVPEQVPENDVVEKINPIIKAIGELKEIVSNMGAEASANVKAIRAESVEAQRTESTQGFARPHSDKAVMQQITTRFQMVAAQNGSEIRIQLKPEHLGSVKISLEIQQDTVVARLQVDSDRVKHIVETNMQQLKDTLEQQGLKLEKFDVSVNDGKNEFFKRELSEQGRRIRGKIRQEIDISEGVEGVEAHSVDAGRGLGYSTVTFMG